MAEAQPSTVSPVNHKERPSPWGLEHESPAEVCPPASLGGAFLLGNGKQQVERTMGSTKTVANGDAECQMMKRRVDELNQEMMRLPQEERRQRWKEYYTRLGELRGSLQS